MDKRHTLGWAICVVFFSSLLSGQSTRVELFGVVRDPSELPVAGAAVEIRNRDTSATASATSDSSGLYRFAALTPGSYEVTVRKDGFSLLKRTGLTFRVGEQISLDLSLKVGDISQSVEVTGAAPLLQSARATVSFTVNK